MVRDTWYLLETNKPTKLKTRIKMYFDCTGFKEVPSSQICMHMGGSLLP